MLVFVVVMALLAFSSPVEGHITNCLQTKSFHSKNNQHYSEELSMWDTKESRFTLRRCLRTKTDLLHRQSSVDDIEEEDDEDEYYLEDTEDMGAELMSDTPEMNTDDSVDRDSYYASIHKDTRFVHNNDDDNHDDDHNYKHVHTNNPTIAEKIDETDLIQDKETAVAEHQTEDNPWSEEDIVEVIHELWRPHIVSFSSIMTANQDPILPQFHGRHNNNTNIISLYHKFYQDLVEEFRDPVSSLVKTSASAIYNKKASRSVSSWFFDNAQEKNQNLEGSHERRNEENQQSLISLRGAAMIALYPQAMSSLYGGELVPRYQRGISLTLPAIFFPSTADSPELHIHNRSSSSSTSHRIQHGQHEHYMPNLLLGLLSRALATSFRSDMVIIDAQLVSEISQQARHILNQRHKAGHSKNAKVSTATVLKHLFTLLNDDKDTDSNKRPVTVVFAGDIQSWLLQDNAACETIVQQFQSLVKTNNHIVSPRGNNCSRAMFFLHLAPPASVTTPTKNNKKEGIRRNMQQQMKTPNNKMPPQGMMMPMPPFPMRGMFPPGMIISGPFSGQNMAPSASSDSATQHSPMMVTSRTFKVMVHKNGSFSMIPMHSSTSSSPNAHSPDVSHLGIMGMSPMHNGMFPMPPEHIMKQIMEDQQRFMQQMQHNQNENNNDNVEDNHEEDNSGDDLDVDNGENHAWNEDMKSTSNLSMEEIQENLKHLLEDPDALKSAMEYAQQSISQMISKQNSPNNNKNAKPNHIPPRRMPFTRTPLPATRTVPSNQDENHNNINKNPNDHKDGNPLNSNKSDLKLSTAGKRLKMWFEPLSLLIPSRPASPLMYKWSVLLTAHAKEAHFAQNIALLQQELSRVHMRQLSQERIDELWRLSHTKALEGALWTKLWQKEDIRKVITVAIRLQASAFVPSDVNAAENNKIASENDIKENKTESIVENQSRDNNTNNDSYNDRNNDNKSNNSMDKSGISSMSKGARQELSRWALETAFAYLPSAEPVAEGVHSSLAPPSPPSATRRFTSREEIAQHLSLDKYEKNLLTNVVFPAEIDVSFEEVGGLSEVKRLLRQSITYPLKYPSLYREGIAKEAVKGVLLFGPPGTGKTLLAKAVATEGGACFLSVDASVIENKWLGESEKNARAVFSLARKLAPCVVFFDEVDSLLSSRETGTDDTSSHGTLTSVKTTLMAEWDGLTSHASSSASASASVSSQPNGNIEENNPSQDMDMPNVDLNYGIYQDIESLLLSSLVKDQHHHIDQTDNMLGNVLPDKDKSNKVIVIASTNRPFDLDEAVLRRLPRRILVDLPDLPTRAAILQVALAQNRIDPSVNFTDIAKRLEGFTGSDIKEICREAVVQIAHEQAEMLEHGPSENNNNNHHQHILRMVTARDLYRAMRRLRASVNEHGRELQKVVEWNEKYGEFRSDNVEKTSTNGTFVSGDGVLSSRSRGSGQSRRTDLYL